MPTPFDVSKIPGRVKPVAQFGAMRVHQLPDWGGYEDPQKLLIINHIAKSRGRDPRIAKQAVDILKAAKVKPRDYKGQAAALLAWVQNPKNIYYVNEPGERLQDPIYTLKVKMGDCDDMTILLCSLFESVMLPWKLVISGRNKVTKEKVRHIEGNLYPQNVAWSHIYCMVGTPAFSPKIWYYCEPTVPGVPLGWDVVDGDPGYIPEMDKPVKGPARIVSLPPKTAVAVTNGYGSTVGTSVAAAIAEDSEQEQRDGHDHKINYKAIAQSIFLGVTISVATQIILDWVRGSGASQPHGPGFARIKKALFSSNDEA